MSRAKKTLELRGQDLDVKDRYHLEASKVLRGASQNVLKLYLSECYAVRVSLHELTDTLGRLVKEHQHSSD